jgi:regulator of sirC expression with transglutaminase-like and TPR domain
MDFPLARQRFYQEISQPEHEIDLASAALYVAQEEYPELDPQVYYKMLDAMADVVAGRLPEARYPLKVVQTLSQYLFQDLGFEGNEQSYYDPRNSYFNQVIDRRLGIPITLSLVYLEVSKRLGFPMVGVGMPGHFLIRPAVDEMAVFVDAFNQGEVLFEQDCLEKFRQLYGDEAKWHPDFLRPITAKPFLTRMLTNLKVIYLHQPDFRRAIAIMDRLLLLSPNNAHEHRDRGLVHYQLQNGLEARHDLEQYLFYHPNAPDADTIQHLIDQL